MQKQLANFKQSFSPINVLYSSSTIESLIIDYVYKSYTLEETVFNSPERYILFIYERSLNIGTLETHYWTRFVWIFDKVTRNRLRIETSDLNYIKENYSPSQLEIY